MNIQTEQTRSEQAVKTMAALYGSAGNAEETLRRLGLHDKYGFNLGDAVRLHILFDHREVRVDYAKDGANVDDRRFKDWAKDYHVDGNDIAKAIEHGVNCASIDAAANMPDFKIVEKVMPFVIDYLQGTSGPQAIARGEYPIPEGVYYHPTRRVFLLDNGELMPLDFNEHWYEKSDQFPSFGLVEPPINVYWDEERRCFVDNDGREKLSSFHEIWSFRSFDFPRYPKRNGPIRDMGNGNFYVQGIGLLKPTPVANDDTADADIRDEEVNPYARMSDIGKQLADGLERLKKELSPHIASLQATVEQMWRKLEAAPSADAPATTTTTTTFAGNGPTRED